MFAPAQRAVTPHEQTGIMKKIALPAMGIAADAEPAQIWPGLLKLVNKA